MNSIALFWKFEDPFKNSRQCSLDFVAYCFVKDAVAPPVRFSFTAGAPLHATACNCVRHCPRQIACNCVRSACRAKNTVSNPTQNWFCLCGAPRGAVS